MLTVFFYDDNGKYIGEKNIRFSFYVPHVSTMRMYDTHECVYPQGVTNNG